MKAIVYQEYGSPDVLKCEETERPVPKDDEVLIKVRAASNIVCPPALSINKDVLLIFAVDYSKLASRLSGSSRLKSFGVSG